jgi:hypothetical protein
MIVTQKKELRLLTPKYCESIHQTKRRPTRTVEIGKVKVGSEHPIALQTMTTTDTRDVEGTVEQVKRCADAGADIVRITVQSKREAEACLQIRERLFQDRCNPCCVPVGNRGPLAGTACVLLLPLVPLSRCPGAEGSAGQPCLLKGTGAQCAASM